MLHGRARSSGQKSFVGFAVGTGSYAVPVHLVQEILRPVPVSEVPCGPQGVAGVVEHRGNIIPLIDLRGRFGVKGPSDPLRQKWILVQIAGKQVGMVVDDVTEVFGVNDADMRPAPEVSQSSAQSFVGVMSRRGTLTFILDMSRFDGASESRSFLEIQTTEGDPYDR